MSLYFPHLNGLRFIAALLVIVYHFYGISIINGHYGVILFFVLSGFLITFLLLEEKKLNLKINIKKFYMRRILRIWPLYFLVIFISGLSNLFNNSFLNFIELLPYYLFFIPNVTFALGLNLKYADILWSIGSEEQFYLIWPWLIKWMKPASFIKMNIIIIVSWTFVPHILDYINHNFFNELSLITKTSKIINYIGFNSMATGAFFAYLLFKKNKILIYFFSYSVQIVNLSLIIIFLGFDILPFLHFVDQIYALLFGILIVNLAGNNKVILNLEYNWLNYLGKISFGLYVFHLIIINFTYFIISYFSLFINKNLIFIFSVLLTILISSISYKFFEAPFVKMKNRLFSYKK